MYNGALSVTWLNDGTNGVICIEAVTKTGNHYPEIASIFANVTASVGSVFASNSSIRFFATNPV